MDDFDKTVARIYFNLGIGDRWAEGDVNGDGLVNDADLGIIETNLGFSNP